MRWRGRRQSENVEDRRGQGTRGMKIGGGVGIGTLILAAVIYFMGGNPLQVLQQPPQGEQDPQKPPTQQEQDLRDFAAVVLQDTEDVWSAELPRQIGKKYRVPKLVIYTQATQTGCGLGDAGMGPFYCPADEDVYIDLQFFVELKTRFGAPGDFAAAYVIAHEVGHHVQNIMERNRWVHAQQQSLSELEGKRLSVRLELQADYYAGVWAHHAQKKKNILEEGDIEEALGAAAAVGDDTLQRKSGRRVDVDSFSHGSAEQRARWFRKGFQSGDINAGEALFQLPYEDL